MIQFNGFLDVVQILLVIGIVIIVIKLFRNNNSNEDFSPIGTENNNNKNIEKTEQNTFAESVKHLHFHQGSYHNDYRFFITISNMLNGKSKSDFNSKGLPVLTDKDITSEIKNNAKKFVTFVNKYLTEKNTEKRWDNLTQGDKVQTGFERAQYNLGLPVSNYNFKELSSPLKLINVESSEKLETEDEIQIKITFTIGKVADPNTDQLLLTLKLNATKNKLQEDMFFKQKDYQLLDEYKISEVYVNGYYSKTLNFGSYTDAPEYKEAKDNKENIHEDITKMDEEIKFIEDHYKQRSKENEYRVSTLDEEGKAFNSSIMFLSDDYYKKNYRTRGGKRKFI